MKKLFACLSLGLLPALGRAQNAAKTSPYDSAHFSWRKPVPRQRLRELQPDRPGVTESPFTVDAGHAQLEMDILRLSNSGPNNEEQTREWHLAYSTFKLGLGRRTDVQLQMPLYNVVKQRPMGISQWEESHSGFGDVTVRLKHNFVGDDQTGTFAMAVIGYVRLPTGGATGDGASQYGIVLPVDIELSDKANLEAQFETDLNYDREQARHYLGLVPSVALEYDFTEKMGLLTEAAAQWNTAQRRWQASLNIAPIVKLTPDVQLDFGTHLALNRQSDREYFVGFTIRR